MNDHVLVTYSSRYGSTEAIAQRIGDTLTRQGVTADVLPITDVKSLAEYDAYVLGGAIYSGQWPTDLVEFINFHETTLREKPSALFVVAIRLRDDSEEMRQSVLGIIDTYRVMLNPGTIGLFAGMVDYDKLSPIVRLQAETKRLPEGDFRNWEAIDEWANTLQSQLAVVPEPL